MKIGIDIGSSTTKIVTLLNSNTLIRNTINNNKKILNNINEEIEKFIKYNSINKDNIQSISLTGVGAEKVKKRITNYNISIENEIISIGKGAIYLSNNNNIIISNIGTGTAIVEAKNNIITQIGGSAVGGGTIVGLSKAMMSINDINALSELASDGEIGNVDLLIKDISDTKIGILTENLSASNFGKLNDNANSKDIALGIFNLVYQTIGIISVFAAKSRGFDSIIISGKASNNEIGKEILNKVAQLYNFNFVYIDNSEYTTAIGAIL